jgi:type VI protein secretion system component VasA
VLQDIEISSVCDVSLKELSVEDLSQYLSDEQKIPAEFCENLEGEHKFSFH